MGAAEQRNFTTENTIQLLQERAGKDGDTFSVKVFRKPHAAALAQLVSSLSGATLEHFTSPELWVPNLSGGGKYLLQAFHASDPTKAIGGFINFPIETMDARDVDFDAPAKAGWRGPAQIEFPKREAVRQQENLPLYGIHSPPAPGSGDSANQTTWSRQAGGGSVRREQYNEGGGPWREGAAALEAERRMLEKEKLEAEREKHRSELSAIQSKHDSELKLSMAQLRSEFSAARPQGPDPMATLFTEMMKQANEDRRAAAAQAAEDRRAQTATQERADARFMAMMEKMNDRKEKDPLELVAKVIELTGGGKKGDSAIIDAQAKMMHSMSEMTTHQIGVAMDFVSAAADMQLGSQKEDKPGWEKAADKLIKGIGNFAAARSAAPPPGQQVVNQLPAAPQTYEQQARQQPPPPQQPQQPRPPQNHTEKSVAQQVKEAIEAKHDVKQVAAAIVTYVNDPSIQQAIAAGGGDPEQAIKNLLGPWADAAPSNAEYLKAFFTELTAQAKAAGLYPPDDAEDDDEEDEDDDTTDDVAQGDDE